MRKVIITLVSVALGMVGLVGGAGTALAASSGTVITGGNTPFGKALVVGSGTYKGYSLYDITSDHPPSYGCPATAVPLPPGFPPGFTCTGPSKQRPECGVARHYHERRTCRRARDKGLTPRLSGAEWHRPPSHLRWAPAVPV